VGFFKLIFPFSFEMVKPGKDYFTTRKLEDYIEEILVEPIIVDPRAQPLAEQAREHSKPSEVLHQHKPVNTNNEA
jgi:hypothetical protein